MKNYILHWRNGETQRVSGIDIGDAFHRAGYSSDAISALDYYSTVKETKFGNYTVEKSDGSPVEPDAMYFVLRIDTDFHARVALRAYARSVRASDPDLANELDQWIESCPLKPSLESSKPTQ